MSWQNHHESVAVAIHAVGSVQGNISAGRDNGEHLTALIMACTGGGSTGSEAGRNAFELAASLLEKFDELYRTTEAVKAELERYDGGF